MVAWLLASALAVGAVQAPEGSPSTQTVLPASPLPIGDIPLPGIDSSGPRTSFEALKRWLQDFSEWREHRDDAPHPRDQALWKHQPRKLAPPETLAADCAESVGELGQMADACRALAEWTEWHEDQGAAVLRLERASTRDQDERPTNSRWRTHIHLDALWPVTQSNASLYGVIGMHATMEVAGRFQIFMAPGAMLVNVRSGNGGHEWKPATDWGLTYRLIDLHMPGNDRSAVLHFNFVRVWMFGGASDFASPSVSLAGFSLTFKPAAP